VITIDHVQRFLRRRQGRVAATPSAGNRAHPVRW
jgi:hypothetical protein